MDATAPQGGRSPHRMGSPKSSNDGSETMQAWLHTHHLAKYHSISHFYIIYTVYHSQWCLPLPLLRTQ